MTKDVEMVEGVECQPMECGLSLTHWAVSKGPRQEHQCLHQPAHPFYMDRHLLTQFRRHRSEATAAVICKPWERLKDITY